MATSGMVDPNRVMEAVAPYVAWNPQRFAVTSILLTGPTTGVHQVASTPFTVSLPAGSQLTGDLTVTMDDASGGGTFTPTTVRLSDTDRSKTFTYTPPVTPATKTVSITNNLGLTNPASISYIST